MVSRKKRNVERKKKTRSSLLEAARIVFTRTGYHHTLISDIVAEAGVGQGTFYRYFTSKREIFEALFENFATSLFESFAPLEMNMPSDVESYRESSSKSLLKVTTVLEENRDLTLFFLREGPSIDTEFEEQLAALQEQLAAVAQLYLNHAIENGFARPCNSELVAQSVIGIGLRFLHLWLTDRLTDYELPELINELVDFAFRGFGPLGLQPDK